MDSLGFTLLGFFLGTWVRDIQWWIALNKEWPVTSKLIDWNRVAAIASDGAATS